MDNPTQASDPAEWPTPGLYRHFKGALYTVVGVARHSETQDPHVVYRAEYGARGLWIRPLAMFVEQVPGPEGTLVRRFAYVAASGDLTTELPATSRRLESASDL